MRGKMRAAIFAAAAVPFCFAGCAEQLPPPVREPEYDLEYTVSLPDLTPGFEVSPLIYGEFLEHIPGCIYGTIWAELLEDRKFYYAPGEEGLSPWTVFGKVAAAEGGCSGSDLAASLSDGAGISQQVTLREGRLNGSFYAGGEGILTVKIADREQTFPLEGQFRKYTFTAEVAEDGEHTVSFTHTGGGMLLDSVSLMPSDNYCGMRRDTLDAMKALGGTIYRWPGGNFVSGYCWKDGIGDRDLRPSRRNEAWFADSGDPEEDRRRMAEAYSFYDLIEPNDMGTDEFLAMCEYIGAEPYMAVNTGSGSVEDAADLVEYCNGDAESEYGSLRAENGHALPYSIRYWCVGNEMQGDWQIGHVQIGEYVLRHNAFAEAMKAVDDDIFLTGCGDNASLWSDGMLASCAEHLDLIGEHLYAVNDPEKSNSSHMVSITGNFDLRLKNHRKLLEKYPEASHVRIAFDEYAFGWSAQATMRDALGIAAALNLFIENADIVAMANYSDAVFSASREDAPAALYADEGGCSFSPVGLVLQSYAQYMQKYVLTAFIRQTDRDTALDYQATISEDGKTVSLAIVNPSERTIAVRMQDERNTIETSVSIAGDAEEAIGDIGADAAGCTVENAPDTALIRPQSVHILVVRIG